MRGRGIVFTARERAELEDVEIDPATPGTGEALVRAEYSIVSAGTEGSFYTGLMEEVPAVYRPRPVMYPTRPGYGHLGEVLAVGPGVEHLAPGQRVLSFSRHASLVRCNAARFALPVPADADGRRAVFTRMAGVAITALRASSAGAGDTVAVLGLGLVGNLAAQLFQLAGCAVIGFDLSPRRLALARACGIAEVHHAGEVDPVAATRRWSGARDEQGGARVVVEAIGRSELAAQAVEMAGRHGEVVLLGSPRAPFTGDLTQMLARVHLLAIKLIGALEWTFPIAEETERAPHDLWELPPAARLDPRRAARRRSAADPPAAARPLPGGLRRPHPPPRRLPRRGLRLARRGERLTCASGEQSTADHLGVVTDTH
jgi:2-desacetyl-2-hydroxyethyl bacteriochlorophyllide A dehydrogenase